MAVFNVRIDDASAARFDAAAASAGGRSAMLRRLIVAAADGATAQPLVPREKRDGARIMVRLAPAEAAAVASAADAMKLSPSTWVAALVARHVSGRPRFPPAAFAQLAAILSEVHRIGVNLNQIARALNTAVMEGRVLEIELQAVDDLRRELKIHMHGLREAFAGNLAYWEVEF